VQTNILRDTMGKTLDMADELQLSFDSHHLVSYWMPGRKAGSSLETRFVRLARDLVHHEEDVDDVILLYLETCLTY
jgi:hypothetical protein